LHLVGFIVRIYHDAWSPERKFDILGLYSIPDSVTTTVTTEFLIASAWKEQKVLKNTYDKFHLGRQEVLQINNCII